MLRPRVEYPHFVGPTYRPQSYRAGNEICMNLFPQIESAGASTAITLLNTPGLSDFAQSALSPNRGCFAQDGRCFFAIGFAFYELSAAGVLTPRGTIDSDDNPATISSSGDIGHEIFITSGGNGYIFNLDTSAFTQIADLNGVAQFGDFLDGFFLCLNTVDSILRISDYADGLTWDPLQFRTRATAGDKWVAMKVVSHTNIWLMGSQTYEVWANLGSSPFPFGPIEGAFYTQGIVAPYSLTVVGTSVAWLTANADGQGCVAMSEQYAPTLISDHGVAVQVQRYGDIADAIGMTYQEDQHLFYCLGFKEADKTWCVDMTTGMWHQRGTSNTGNSSFTAWRPMFHCFAFGKHLVGDHENGKIYQMSTNIYTDGSNGFIQRIRRAPHLNNKRQVMFYDEFALDMDTGVGLASGQGSDPKIAMRWSDDGGKTFGNYLTAYVGKQGEWGAKVQWNALGKGTDRVFEIAMSDPVPYRITNAYLRMHTGTR